ncbi:MAG: nickel/cobalt transporter [Pseudomonadota bacterium]
MRLTAGNLATLTAMVGAAVALALLVADAAWSAKLLDVQRALHGRLAEALATVREAGPAAAWPLIALSFAYGVFHAAGPGHGKVVIGTYLATHESRLPQALTLTVLAALAQAVTAIVAVHAAVTVLDLGLRQARGVVGDVETVSFALVTLLGLGLCVRAVRRLWRGTDAQEATCGGHAREDRVDCGHGHDIRVEPGASLWQRTAVVLSIGLRPCSGGVVVLLLAYAGDIRAIGIAAVLAMAVGTALTTSALACLAVFARSSAVGLAERLPGGASRVGRLMDGAAFAGGTLLVVVGAMLLQASFATPAHPFR